jgi:hypothetical protein
MEYYKMIEAMGITRDSIRIDDNDIVNILEEYLRKNYGKHGFKSRYYKIDGKTGEIYFEEDTSYHGSAHYEEVSRMSLKYTQEVLPIIQTIKTIEKNAKIKKDGIWHSKAKDQAITKIRKRFIKSTDFRFTHACVFFPNDSYDVAVIYHDPSIRSYAVFINDLHLEEVNGEIKLSKDNWEKFIKDTAVQYHDVKDYHHVIPYEDLKEGDLIQFEIPRDILK